MIATLLWKEYREQRALWLAIALLALLTIALFTAFLGRGELVDRWRLDDDLRSLLAIVMVVLASAHGVVAGALLLAGERESRTLVFLDIHGRQRSPLWRTKLAAGAALVLAQAVFLATLALGLGFGSPS